MPDPPNEQTENLCKGLYTHFFRTGGSNLYIKIKLSWVTRSMKRLATKGFMIRSDLSFSSISSWKKQSQAQKPCGNHAKKSHMMLLQPVIFLNLLKYHMWRPLSFIIPHSRPSTKWGSIASDIYFLWGSCMRCGTGTWVRKLEVVLHFVLF